MSNPFSGIISSELKTLFTNAIDALLEDSALTWPCRLIYGDTKFTLCPNCITDPVTRKSSNRYNGAGPRPFNNGQICPMCNGQSRIPELDTETIYMMVIFDSKQFIQMSGFNSKININAPKTYVQSMCDVSLFAKLKKTKELIIDTDKETYSNNKYIRACEPEFIGWGQSSYIITMWERAG